MSALKTYNRNQYTGNENGWYEPVVTLGTSALTEDKVAELNSQFRNTGIKYETAKGDVDTTDVTTTNQADHGEPGLVVKNDEFVPSKNKAKEKAAQLNKEGVPSAEPSQDPASPKADDAFVQSDGQIKHAEIDEPEKQPNINTTAGH